jgi:hypothetical protein
MIMNRVCSFHLSQFIAHHTWKSDISCMNTIKSMITSRLGISSLAQDVIT